MATKEALEKRVVELEREMFVGKMIGGMSYALNTASDEDELLQTLAKPARDAGANGADLVYIDLDEHGEPEWAEIMASWRQVGESSVPVGARFVLAEFPFSKLWMANPNEPQLMTDVTTDENVDDNLKGMLTQSGIRSMVTIPLVYAKRWVGLVTFNWNDEPHEFGEQETETYRAMAGLAAPIVENRRLLAQTQKMLAEREQAEIERERLQEEVIEAQKRAIAELSTPVIPIMDRVIVMPMVGSIDSMRARDITRALLAGIGHHRAKIVILDVTGVSLMDTGIVNHLNKTIQAAQLKGAQTIVTGISDAVAESIVDLGIDWSGITTLSDLQTGLLVALDSLGVRLTR